MKRFPQVLIAVVALALAITAGCRSRARATTTLHFSTQQGSSDVVFEALAANFHKAYPDIEIKMDYYPLVSYQQRC